MGPTQVGLASSSCENFLSPHYLSVGPTAELAAVPSLERGWIQVSPGVPMQLQGPKRNFLECSGRFLIPQKKEMLVPSCSHLGQESANGCH